MLKNLKEVVIAILPMTLLIVILTFIFAPLDSDEMISIPENNSWTIFIEKSPLKSLLPELDLKMQSQPSQSYHWHLFLDESY